ncbi:MAG TPA: hypothetical protein PLI29_13370 [Verrucomicrobiota bacterium]|nr:hypothetical protein [Verrucomicrobiota bacterium]
MICYRARDSEKNPAFADDVDGVTIRDEVQVHTLHSRKYEQRSKMPKVSVDLLKTVGAENA